MLKNIDKCVVIAPHPDDETLGLGGSIARMSSLGIDVSIYSKWSSSSLIRCSSL